MKKENLYLIHGEDYLRHIEEKLELLWTLHSILPDGHRPLYNS